MTRRRLRWALAGLSVALQVATFVAWRRRLALAHRAPNGAQAADL
jgi:hypothetical protein